MAQPPVDPALTEAAVQIKVMPKDQIVFTGPFDQMKVVDLTLTNDSKFRLAYKFRCTRPEGLKFRPGYGVIRPSREKVVKVRCLPITGATPAKDRCTMIVVALADDQRADKGSKFWKNPDNPPQEMNRVTWEVKYEGGTGPVAKDEGKEKEEKDDESEGGDETSE